MVIVGVASADLAVRRGGSGVAAAGSASQRQVLGFLCRSGGECKGHFANILRKVI